MSRWVLLDRDGVINEDSENYIKSEAEWVPLPGSLEAIVLLTQAGFNVGVATNQSGIARNLYSLDTLNKIHEKMHQSVNALGGKISAIAFCPHGPDDRCDCRKPKPGLLHALANEHGFSLKDTPYVGDAYRDIEAALAVGATPVLVLSGKGKHTLSNYSNNLKNILVFDDLYAFATFLIKS